MPLFTLDIRFSRGDKFQNNAHLHPSSLRLKLLAIETPPKDRLAFEFFDYLEKPADPTDAAPDGTRRAMIAGREVQREVCVVRQSWKWR